LILLRPVHQDIQFTDIQFTGTRSLRVGSKSAGKNLARMRSFGVFILQIANLAIFDYHHL